MKKQIIITTFSMIVIFFIASCGSNTSENKATENPIEQTSEVKYQCPMDCEEGKTYDKPGQCAVCNMDLQKVEAKSEHGEHGHKH